MKNEKEYFENADKIVSAINRAKKEAAEALEKSDSESQISKTCFRQGPAYAHLGESHRMTSKKWARKYVLLTEKTIPALVQKLAEMKTPMMFEELSPSILRRINKSTKK